MQLNKVSHIYTLARVAADLEEDEDLLFDLIDEMEPEDGLIWVYGPGEEPPGVAFVYSGDRATSSPALHLAGYRGVLQTDGYGAYKALAKEGAVELAFCWAHARPATSTRSWTQRTPPRRRSQPKPSPASRTSTVRIPS